MTSDALSRLDQALEMLDFTGARAAIAEAPEEAQSEMQTHYEEMRSEAEDRAEQLAGRIQSMARADHYEGLLGLAADDTTEPLLELLSPELKRGAILHLDGARRRQDRFRSAGVKHMDSAREALILLDTTRARAELDRVDRRWLNESQRSALDDLEQQAEEAAEERRDLDARTAEVLKDHHPSQAPAKSGGSRSSALSRRGCGGSVLMILAMVTAAAAILI